MDLFSLETLLGWLHHYGYGVVFGGILLENAGLPIPGETLTLIGGFLAGTGELELPWVFLMAIAGAIVGDTCGYWLGRWGGIAALESITRFFRIPEAELAAAQERFRSNGGRAVFLGRFITLLRIFAGPLAGMTGMPYGRFLAFNALGAIAWGTLMTSLAYGVGRFAGVYLSLADLISYVLRFGVLALLGVVAWFVLPLLRRSPFQDRDPLP
jgi:membrane protein DedA with SNARE-associated domain